MKSKVKDITDEMERIRIDIKQPKRLPAAAIRQFGERHLGRDPSAPRDIATDPATVAGAVSGPELDVMIAGYHADPIHYTRKVHEKRSRYRSWRSACVGPINS